MSIRPVYGRPVFCIVTVNKPPSEMFWCTGANNWWLGLAPRWIYFPMKPKSSVSISFDYSSDKKHIRQLGVHERIARSQRLQMHNAIHTCRDWELVYSNIYQFTSILYYVIMISDDVLPLLSKFAQEHNVYLTGYATNLIYYSIHIYSIL